MSSPPGFPRAKHASSRCLGLVATSIEKNIPKPDQVLNNLKASETR